VADETPVENPTASVEVLARAAGVLILAWLTLRTILGGLRYPRPDGVLTILDSANFIFHEGGHFIFGFGAMFTIGYVAEFPALFIGVLGGSLNEVLIPAIFAGYFFWHGKIASGCVTLWWMGQSISGVALYAADGQALRLPLHGSDGSDAAAIHDWHRLLKWTGLLDHATTVGGLFFLVAILTMLAALVLLALDTIHTWRNPPALVLPDE
jgi:hypothetical protein